MKKTMLVTALGMVIAMQSATALAGKHLYPGSMCVRWTGGDVVPMLHHGRIFNTSAAKEMRVDCPIVHHNFNLAGGNNLDDADIGVIDQSPQLDAKCWLASRYQIGAGLFGTTNPGKTVGSGPGEQNLDFKPTGVHVENWYYIGCHIPRSYNGRRSGITYYSGQD